MDTAPEKTDGVVRLRAHRPDDVPEVVAQCQDPEMQRFTAVPAPYTAADAAGFLAAVDAGWRDGWLAAWAVEVEGRFAGTVDLRLQEGDWAEIGYGLAPWARGRGVMARALDLALGWGFGTRGLVGVEWRAYVGNDASRRVAERCGFRVEGTVRGLCVSRGRRVDAWIGTLLSTDPAAVRLADGVAEAAFGLVRGASPEGESQGS
ncbi:GNAT family N-acetyltransferase [Modestobacter sp. Leaf380]|uniref:GNAT family N-acetyltransferase n=1 Tax=Modestobacter sp. Leaf380 TaxID=1736356 RepID=UPI0006FE46DF|nr:GNAT family protein [Modestobacter sp. Leaf380]KQS66592.1 hypothetical protein ASG41_08870 [Modestobacter sp. Leaf380]